MTDNQLASKLKQLWQRADLNSVTAVQIFAIQYAYDIEKCTLNNRDLAKMADIPDGLQTDMQKGTNLAKHVKMKYRM